MSKKKRTLTSEQTIEKICNEVIQFRQQQKTLILATQSKSAEPLASYAPFIEDDDGCFYLLLSGLAQHSTHLIAHQQEQRQLSVLLIEDEQESRNLFARKRLSYVCSVSVWDRDHPLWQEKIAQLQEKFGQTITVLSGLGDFKLYCLKPVAGYYVRGFGQAYDLSDANKPVLRKN